MINNIKFIDYYHLSSKRPSFTAKLNSCTAFEISCREVYAKQTFKNALLKNIIKFS